MRDSRYKSNVFGIDNFSYGNRVFREELRLLCNLRI